MKKIIFLFCLMLLMNNTHVKANETYVKFSPPKNKVLLFIGQDKESIEEYIDATHVIPFGFMVYTSIQKLEGLWTPVDYGSGIHYAQYFVDKYDDMAIQIGLYMVGALESVCNGIYDDNIDQLGEWITLTQRPVFLRIGYEFDFPRNNYNSVKYCKAYQYVVDRLRAANVNNVAYIWHSYGYINPDKSYMDWYPGDEYVDWFGISFFQTYNQNSYDRIAYMAEEHKKPIMIAESTPQGIGTLQGKKSWKKWFYQLFAFTEKHNVQALCYINNDWDSQTMWKGKGWGDSRVHKNGYVKKLWLREIHKDKYIKLNKEIFEVPDDQDFDIIDDIGIDQ